MHAAAARLWPRLAAGAALPLVAWGAGERGWGICGFPPLPRTARQEWGTRPSYPWLLRGSLISMRITVEITEAFAACAAQRGMTPEAYASELLLGANLGQADPAARNPAARNPAARNPDTPNSAQAAPDEIAASWESEALRRAAAIDSGNSQPLPWEQIRSRLHARIAG